MQKDLYLNLVKWLETASEAELDAKKLEIRQRLLRISDPDVRLDGEQMVKIIDQEILARWEAGV